MNASNHEHIEDRLRRALAARADQVTPSSLRAATPVRTAPPRKVTWRAPMLAAAAAATVLVAGVTYAALTGIGGQPAPGPAAPPQPKVVTGSTCPRESTLVEDALRRQEGVPADVDGDGAPDRVVTAVDERGDRGCRAFVGVLTATGTTYSNAMDDVWGRRLTPFPPEVIGVPVLGSGTAAEVVVDTHARADGALAQLFTLTDAGLVQVRVPGAEDGSFLVEGGGVTFPYGAGCRPDGSLVLSSAAAKQQSFEVTRNVYTLDGDELTHTSSATTEVPGNDLFQRFPEFGAPHFAACDGEVRGR